jgi:hypothetical protein
MGAPQEPQKRKLGATSLPQAAQLRAAAIGGATNCGPEGLRTLRPGATMPRDAPHAWQTAAVSGESASHESHTRPMVMIRGS